MWTGNVKCMAVQLVSIILCAFLDIECTCQHNNLSCKRSYQIKHTLLGWSWTNTLEWTYACCSLLCSSAQSTHPCCTWTVNSLNFPYAQNQYWSAWNKPDPYNHLFTDTNSLSTLFILDSKIRNESKPVNMKRCLMVPSKLQQRECLCVTKAPAVLKWPLVELLKIWTISSFW